MSRPRVCVHAARGRYYIRWFCADRDDWAERLDDFKYEFAQWEREFHPATKTWSVPLSCRARVRRWAERWFDPDQREFVEGEPAGGGYGSRSYSHSHSGYGRYGEAQSATTAVERAYAELHLLPSARARRAAAAAPGPVDRRP